MVDLNEIEKMNRETTRKDKRKLEWKKKMKKG